MDEFEGHMAEVQKIALHTKLQMVVAVIVILSAITGVLFWVETRYASASGLLEQGLYTRNYHTESEIERAQDKLESLLILPEAKLFPHQKREILRLNNVIEKKLRQLEILQERDR